MGTREGGFIFLMKGEPCFATCNQNRDYSNLLKIRWKEKFQASILQDVRAFDEQTKKEPP